VFLPVSLFPNGFETDPLQHGRGRRRVDNLSVTRIRWLLLSADFSTERSPVAGRLRRWAIRPRLRITRMKPVTLLLLTTLLAGCQSMRSSMQMDSDSRTPFFSFQLPVRNSARDASKVEVAVEEPRAERHAIRQAGLESAEATEKSWGGWLGKLRKPMSIPLPRTDISDEGEVVETDLTAAPELLNF
jgi:hypothetical protein